MSPTDRWSLSWSRTTCELYAETCGPFSTRCFVEQPTNAPLRKGECVLLLAPLFLSERPVVKGRKRLWWWRLSAKRASEFQFNCKARRASGPKKETTAVQSQHQQQTTNAQLPARLLTTIWYVPTYVYLSTRLLHGDLCGLNMVCGVLVCLLAIFACLCCCVVACLFALLCITVYLLALFASPPFLPPITRSVQHHIERVACVVLVCLLFFSGACAAKQQLSDLSPHSTATVDPPIDPPPLQQLRLKCLCVHVLSCRSP